MPQHEMPIAADEGTQERIRRGETGIPGVKLPSNPTPLSAPQEQQVREIYYRNVRAKCAKEIEAFALCAKNRTFSMAWACRDSKLTMNSCLLSYQKPEEMDKARAEWFALAGERKRAKEERARKEEEARRKHREWWGIADPEGRFQERVVHVEEKVDDKLMSEKERRWRNAGKNV